MLSALYLGTKSDRKQKKSRPPIESFQNYVAIVQDPFTGKIVLRSSSTMKNWRQAILGGEAISKFRAYTQALHGANRESLLLAATVCYN